MLAGATVAVAVEPAQMSEDNNTVELMSAPLPFRLVAHAGGAILGYEMSNSLEAMESAVANGFLFLELDMLPTTDGEIVMTHGWPLLPNRVPGAASVPVSHAEFMDYRLFNQFTPVDLPMLIAFLRANPRVRIITDTKDSDYAALYTIRNRFPAYRDRFIPQAYSFASVSRLRALGFRDIIVTLYMMPHVPPPSELARMALAENIFALCIPDRLATPQFVAALRPEEVTIFIHTVDCPHRANQLFEMGVHGIYTGFLMPQGNALAVNVPDMGAATARVKGVYDALSEAQLPFPSRGLTYKINEPIYLFHGTPYPVRSSGVAAPFVFNREVYLPLSHLIRFFSIEHTHTWHREDNSFSFRLSTQDFRVQASDCGVLVYRDMFFVSERVIQSIFPVRILRLASYVLVLPETDTPFLDVRTGRWYSEAIEFAYANGIKNGTSDVAFTPGASLSRSMLATILWRMADAPTTPFVPILTDVLADRWYSHAVIWAFEHHIVTGTSPTTFAPAAPITREQFAAMLFRYARFSGQDTTVPDEFSLSGFTDHATISAWAMESMTWAVYHGLLVGTAPSTLSPRGTVSRAQSSMILMRFLTE